MFSGRTRRQFKYILSLLTLHAIKLVIELRGLQSRDPFYLKDHKVATNPDNLVGPRRCISMPSIAPSLKTQLRPCSLCAKMLEYQDSIVTVRHLLLHVCFESNNTHYPGRSPYSTSSMTFIVSIVLLLASIAAARAPNSPLLDSYDYISMNSSQT